MVKNKMSGQTIAIIILAVLLVIAIGFGGVYAYYSARSNSVTGKIVMANLKISLESPGSDRSEIVISNGVNIVPGQPLENSPLVIRNYSSAPIYLIVVYEINAVASDDTKVVDDYKNPVLGLGAEYINSIDTDYNNEVGIVNRDWIDYVFNGEAEGKIYRCLVSTASYEPATDAERDIEVIGANKLSLAGAMGNEYQNTSISFTFQAYAIGSETDFGWGQNPSKQERCEKIVNAIYMSQSSTFLNINVNT